MLVKKYFVDKGFRYAMVKDELFKNLRSAGLARVEIVQAPLGTRIILYAQRPGLVIGQRGNNIQALTGELEKKYKIENPHVLVYGLDQPNLEPQALAFGIAEQLERGMYFRKIANATLNNIMQSGARGAEIIIRGRLSIAKSRMARFTSGVVYKSGMVLGKQTELGKASALLKEGLVGVKVRITKPGVPIDAVLVKQQKEGERVVA
ncbi:MAG: 30S ribosomal protein S3 [Thermoprotei archaeon]